ncbi:hypothetical protein Vqi01_43170 [Micromonospora qiuiae]|uniref:Uncharacterized protein n=1 Tax=Micromonospora qiuiae TaxID=502268 RepID=A0ABQ4JFM6_9ACTN|nr:hypothetical protein Vqi01_43170 [Micromonospora qiuiae]
MRGGGERLRVRLSNLYGKQPLTIARTRVAALEVGSSIIASIDTAVTFGGTPHGPATYHPFALQTGYVARGDVVSHPKLPDPEVQDSFQLHRLLRADRAGQHRVQPRARAGAVVGLPPRRLSMIMPVDRPWWTVGGLSPDDGPSPRAPAHRRAPVVAIR